MDHTTLDSKIHGLMAGFFSGTSGRKEIRQLNEWLEQDTAHLDEFNRMRSAWIMWHHDAGKKDFDAHARWPELYRRINGMQERRFARFITPMRYAASLALCIAITSIVSILLMHSNLVEGGGGVNLIL